MHGGSSRPCMQDWGLHVDMDSLGCDPADGEGATLHAVMPLHVLVPQTRRLHVILCLRLTAVYGLGSGLGT